MRSLLVAVVLRLLDDYGRDCDTKRILADLVPVTACSTSSTPLLRQVEVAIHPAISSTILSFLLQGLELLRWHSADAGH